MREPRHRTPSRARRRSAVALAVSASLVVAACSDGDSASETTLTEITLLTTTTEAPVFEPETTIATIEESATPTSAAPDTTIPETTTTTTTTTTPETTVATTTTTPPPASPFSIRPDGIGAAAFGAAPEGVVDFVVSVLGPPDRDTGWIDPFEIGPCGGNELRQVQWATLILEFGDVSNVAEGRRHFYGYYYGDGASPSPAPPGLATDDGLAVGSSVADLLQVHPEVALFSGDEFLGPNFQINDALRGTLTGLADNDTITSFVGGLPCNG